MRTTQRLESPETHSLDRGQASALDVEATLRRHSNPFVPIIDRNRLRSREAGPARAAPGIGGRCPSSQALEPRLNCDRR